MHDDRQFSRHRHCGPLEPQQLPKLEANLLVEADLGEVRQAIGVIGIGLVGRHVERRGGVTRIDANGREPLGCQRMKEPYRQRSGLKDHLLGARRALADDVSYQFGIRQALAARDPCAISTNRNRRVFHRHVQAYKLFHGCSPIDVWA